MVAGRTAQGALNQTLQYSKRGHRDVFSYEAVPIDFSLKVRRHTSGVGAVNNVTEVRVGAGRADRDHPFLSGGLNLGTRLSV